MYMQLESQSVGVFHQKSKLAKYLEDSTNFLGAFEKVLEENGQVGYFVGNKVLFVELLR
jgi:chaperonin cofactor prefoldin